VNTGGDIRFLDETRELMSLYDHDLPTSHPETATPWTRNEDRSNLDVEAGGERGNIIDNSMGTNPSQGHVDLEDHSAAFSPTKRRKVLSPTDSSSWSIVQSPNQFVPPTVRSSQQSNVEADEDGSSQFQRGIQSADASVDHTMLQTPTRDDDLGAIYQAERTEIPVRSQVGFSPDTQFSWRPSPAHNVEASQAPSPDTPGRLYLKAPVWPLAKLEEAELLRYFVENLARSFDLTDG
jgi:hypothetical protein